MRSMTGYGEASVEIEIGTISVTVRSVNHKSLDLRFRSVLPVNVQNEWLAATRAKLSRGAVEIFVDVQFAAGMDVLDVQKFTALYGQLEGHLQSGTLPAMPSADWIASRCGGQEDAEIEYPISVLEAALEHLVQSRAEEGKALAQELRRITAECVTLVDRIEAGAVQDIENQKKKIVQRWQEISVGLTADSQTVPSEVTSWLIKGDITEEIVRLRHHFESCERLCSSSDPCGKEFAIVAQEMQREANTLMTKTLSVDLKDEAVQLKLLVDQMREQIANVE